MNARWRNRKRWCSSLALGLTIGLFQSGPLVAQTVPGSVQERGKIVYDQHCAVRHGAQGRANRRRGDC